jgi:hypothetical protein
MMTDQRNGKITGVDEVNVPSKMTQAVMLLTFIPKIPGSNLCWKANYRD